MRLNGKRALYELSKSGSSVKLFKLVESVNYGVIKLAVLDKLEYSDGFLGKVDYVLNENNLYVFFYLEDVVFAEAYVDSIENSNELSLYSLGRSLLNSNFKNFRYVRYGGVFYVGIPERAFRYKYLS